MIGMITVTDNFLDKDEVQELENTSMVYSKVHWIGREAEPENALHELVHEIYAQNLHLIYYSTDEYCPSSLFENSYFSGATAWWNIRPVDPKPHSDLISYCTSNGVDYTPDPPPTTTFLYYLKAPEYGGRLNIYTKPSKWDEQTEADSIAAIPNRLVSFPIEYVHAVRPFRGNRISIGVVFWHTLPIIYGETNSFINDSYDRPWETEVNDMHNSRLTEEYMKSISDD